MMQAAALLVAFVASCTSDSLGAPGRVQGDLHIRDLQEVASAAPDTAWRYTLVPERTTAAFFARGTLGSFRGTTSDVSGWLELPDTVGLTGARGEVEIQLATLRTGMGIRDGDTRSTLETERFPVASFVLGEIEPLEADSITHRAMITGDLTVHGQPRQTEFTTTYRFSGDTLFAMGEAQVRLSDFGITRRRRFLGLLSVDDQVGLAFEAMFVRERGGGSR
ncbi:MAG: YceI family protein [Gemmatimonadetes bacterium]|nr:YceI family protein [Gemmatimonadota bacterium]